MKKEQKIMLQGIKDVVGEGKYDVANHRHYIIKPRYVPSDTLIEISDNSFGQDGLNRCVDYEPLVEDRYIWEGSNHPISHGWIHYHGHLTPRHPHIRCQLGFVKKNEYGSLDDKILSPQPTQDIPLDDFLSLPITNWSRSDLVITDLGMSHPEYEVWKREMGYELSVRDKEEVTNPITGQTHHHYYFDIPQLGGLEP